MQQSVQVTGRSRDNVITGNTVGRDTLLAEPDTAHVVGNLEVSG